MVHDLERRVRLAKTNVEAMCNIMAKWCEAPLYRRKGEKKDSLLFLEVDRVTAEIKPSGSGHVTAKIKPSGSGHVTAKIKPSGSGS